MLTNVSELRDFILWAKSQGLKRVKVGDVEFEVHDSVLIEALYPTPKPEQKANEETDTQKTLLDAVFGGDEDDESLLFASSGT